MARVTPEPRAVRRRLLAWHDRHGRKTLPWQRTRNAYHIWVSEIMLQQTQVATVIPYYERFLKRFPDVAALARARLDTVLHYWTGLGYYARARNLKKAAEIIVREHDGRFPQTLDAVMALPGIGRSTAGAILAFAFNQRHPILDGNVKRVLTRLHAVTTPVAQRDTETHLWQLADHYTPRVHVAHYTQAIMDLGATLCTTRRPRCPDCPLTTLCQAHHLGNPEHFPVRTARAALPVKKTTMLMVRDADEKILLIQRPPTGLWGGLWSFPECGNGDAITKACRADLGLRVVADKPWPVLHHTFSHFRLDITPQPARLVGAASQLRETGPAIWFDPRKPGKLGFSAPVKQLLKNICSN